MAEAVEVAERAVAVAHNAIRQSAINDERKTGTLRQKIKTIKSRLFREEYSSGFQNSDTTRWEFKSAIQTATSDLEWEALRSFDGTYREEIVRSEADKLAAGLQSPAKVKELLRRWVDISASKEWIWEIENGIGGIYLGENAELSIEKTVIENLFLDGEQAWKYNEALVLLLNNPQEDYWVGPGGFLGPVGDDVSFVDFEKFWTLQSSGLRWRLKQAFTGSGEPSLGTTIKWKQRGSYETVVQLRNICKGNLKIFKNPHEFKAYVRHGVKVEGPRLLAFNTLENDIQDYLDNEFMLRRNAVGIASLKGTIIACYADNLMVVDKTDTCWLALEFGTEGRLPSVFGKLEEIAIAEMATSGELDDIRKIVRCTQVARKVALEVIPQRPVVTSVSRSMLSEFSIFQSLKVATEAKNLEGGAEEQLSNLCLINELLAGAYLGLGLACEVFEENRTRLQESDLGHWEYGGEELWLCELAKAIGMRAKALPQLMMKALKRDLSKVTFGRASVAFLNAENGIAKVWYDDRSENTEYEMASLDSDTSIEAVIATIYIASTLRPQLRLSGGLELVMDEGATLKMITAASEGLPKFAGQARTIIRENINIKSKRALWNSYQIRVQDVLNFIEEVSHNIASSRDKAFVKRETLVLLGNEGVRPKKGEQTCLLDACCETTKSPKAIVGDASVSGEGVSIFKHENQEFVKTGRQGQFARVTHDESGVIHIHASQQETVTNARFDRNLDCGSLLGATRTARMAKNRKNVRGKQGEQEFDMN